MDGNDIVDFLKENGFEAFLPGMQVGECKTEYVVVKAQFRNPIPGISTSSQLYDMLCYVPQNKRSRLEAFVTDVEKSLVELGKIMAIRTLHTRSNDYFDINVRGHLMSTSFQVYYKNE